MSINLRGKIPGVGRRSVNPDDEWVAFDALTPAIRQALSLSPTKRICVDFLKYYRRFGEAKTLAALAKVNDDFREKWYAALDAEIEVSASKKFLSDLGL